MSQPFVLEVEVKREHSLTKNPAIKQRLEASKGNSQHLLTLEQL